MKGRAEAAMCGFAVAALTFALGAAPAVSATPKLCGPAMMPLIRERIGFAPGVGSIERSATEGRYAFTMFTAGEGGGNALFTRERGRWCLVNAHGSMMDAVLLVAMGVPPAIARRLARAVNGAAEGG